MVDRPRLAVLGSPISHSKSPAIHLAAYRVLGLDWSYDAIEVRSGDLTSFLAGCGSQWRGLSLTMPLKREVLSHLALQDEVSDLASAANTVLFTAGGLSGYNTDVYGAERLLMENLAVAPQRAFVLGGGATSNSIVVALAKLGTRMITVSTRSPQKAAGLADLSNRLDAKVTVGNLAVEPGAPDVVVSTLPGSAALVREFPEAFRNAVPLVDIAYDPWPTSIAGHWLQAGGTVVNGLGMLVYQALAQVRLFVGGDPERELPREADVLEAMRAAAFGSA